MNAHRTIATAPGALPLLGHTVALLRNALGFLNSLPDHGDLVRVRLGPSTAIVVCDPDLTRQLLLDDRTFDKGGFFVDMVRDVLGNGVGFCPHSDHRRQRRLTQPAFHPDRLPSYAQTMTDQIVAVTGAWCEGQSIDVLAEMKTITIRTVAATLVGSALSPATLTELFDDFTAVAAGAYRRMLLPPPLKKLPTPGNRRYVRARARLRRTVATIIADYRNSGIDHGDLLSILLATRDDRDGQGLSDTEINDQIVTFFVAGMETTADTLAWALHLLAEHPDVQQRLHAEIDTVLAGRTPALEDLPKLELAGHIITETLRLYPPIWIVTRATTTDTQLGQHPLPTGTTIVVSPYLIQHRPDLHPDPEHFDPDRWNNHRATAPPRSGFIAFGGGARKCMGDTFALTEATLALATITAHWHLDPVWGHRVHPAVGPTLSPRGPRMRATARATDCGVERTH